MAKSLLVRFILILGIRGLEAEIVFWREDIKEFFEKTTKIAKEAN